MTIRGKRRELGLGSPPLVSLAEAREKATANKKHARDGGDPLAEKRKVRDTLTFGEAVERYLEHKLAEFRNDKHRKQWRATLDTYAAPILGPKPVQEIEVRDVLRVLQPIWSNKTETASRLRGRIEAVLSWATVAGHRVGDNPARWVATSPSFWRGLVRSPRRLIMPPCRLPTRRAGGPISPSGRAWRHARSSSPQWSRRARARSGA